MATADGAEGNIARLAEIFPQCVTETRDERTGRLTRKVDFDKLREELQGETIGDREERYQFTWPDKTKAIRLANAPIAKTLRPCREESVDFDNTRNIYIEGDNLDALKCLKETYLRKVKMIYIDPPYNTGNDFVYEDDFAMTRAEYAAVNGERDEEGNRLVLNSESNGRFHTDWLNMIYPRLKVARDLLTDDGVIFISIDDNEVENLRKVCDEIFGEGNFVATVPWRKRTAKSDVPFGVSQDFEWTVVVAKSSDFIASLEGKERKYFTTDDFPNRPWRVHDMSTQRTATERPNSDFTIENPKNGEKYPVNPQAVWRITKEGLPSYLKDNRIVFPGDYDFLNITKPVLRYWKEDDEKKAGDYFGRTPVSTKLPETVGMSQDGTKEITSLFDAKVFSFPKPISLIKHYISTLNATDALILDFFSGSATTAHAVMQLNAEDGGRRRFIMVQLPEPTNEKSEARKAGYKTICEIGKERIRRAGRKIMEEGKSAQPDLFTNVNGGGVERPLDIGFRVLKLDSTNMEEIYYTPQETSQANLFSLVDNVKVDRTAEDLLFQTMLELGATLDSKIEKTEAGGRTIYDVAEGYIVACFDKDVTDEAVTAIAKMQPAYAVLRDTSMATDSTATNFEQIFRTYSPNTTTRTI